VRLVAAVPSPPGYFKELLQTSFHHAALFASISWAIGSRARIARASHLPTISLNLARSGGGLLPIARVEQASGMRLLQKRRQTLSPITATGMFVPVAFERVGKIERLTGGLADFWTKNSAKSTGRTSSRRTRLPSRRSFSIHC
jgi:hypothetical protein